MPPKRRFVTCENCGNRACRENGYLWQSLPCMMAVYDDRIDETGACYWWTVGTHNLWGWWNTYDNAKWYCNKYGMTGLYFDDDNERRVVLDLVEQAHWKFRESTSHIWSGIAADGDGYWRYEESIGSWGYLDDVGYAPWAEGEPSSVSGPWSCVILDKYDKMQYKVDRCSAWRNFICKKRVENVLEK